MLCTPIYPMVLLIITPIKWLFHWEYTLFSSPNPWPYFQVPTFPWTFFGANVPRSTWPSIAGGQFLGLAGLDDVGPLGQLETTCAEDRCVRRS